MEFKRGFTDAEGMMKVIENGIFQWDEIEDYRVDESETGGDPVMWIKLKDDSEFNIIVKKL